MDEKARIVLKLKVIKYQRTTACEFKMADRPKTQGKGLIYTNIIRSIVEL